MKKAITTIFLLIVFVAIMAQQYRQAFPQTREWLSWIPTLDTVMDYTWAVIIIAVFIIMIPGIIGAIVWKTISNK